MTKNERPAADGTATDVAVGVPLNTAAAGETVETTRSPLREKDFRYLVIGQTLSEFGTQVTLVAVPLVAVVALGAASVQVGVLRALQQLPYLLFVLFVGVVVDRWRRRNVLITADAGRAMALAAIPATAAMHALGMPTLYVVAFLLGTFTVLFDVAYQAYLPRLVHRDQLARSNSMLESSRSSALILGPALGGSLVTLLSAPYAVVASTACFLLSALTVWRIRRPEPRPVPAQRKTSTLRQIREGLVLVARSPVLRSAAVTGGIFNFSFAAYTVIYLVYLPEVLHLSGFAIGLVFAATGPGLLVGALFASWLPKRFGYGRMLVLSALVSDTTLLWITTFHGGGTTTVVLLILINFCYACVGQTFKVALVTIRQAVTPDSVRGRAAATQRFLGVGLVPLGSLFGGFLGDQVGLRLGLLIAVLAMCLAPLSLIPSPLARIGRTLPDTMPEQGEP
jgi:MFS family permease